MTKNECIDNIAKRLRLPKKQVGDTLDTFHVIMGTTLKKDHVFRWPQFGTLEVRQRKARKGRNPRTGVTINIKASKTVGFRPAAALKEAI